MDKVLVQSKEQPPTNLSVNIVRAGSVCFWRSSFTGNGLLVSVEVQRTEWTPRGGGLSSDAELNACWFGHNVAEDA